MGDPGERAWRRRLRSDLISKANSLSVVARLPNLAVDLMVCAQLSFASWLVNYYSHDSPCRTHSAVPLTCERSSKRKSSGMSAYQLIPAHARGSIGLSSANHCHKSFRNQTCLRTCSPASPQFFSLLAASQFVRCHTHHLATSNLAHAIN